MSAPNRTAISPLLHGLIDDAAVFPPGNAALPDALSNHREYRNSWYSALVGPLLLPLSKLGALDDCEEELRIGVIVDTVLDAVSPAVAALPDNVEVAQVEARASGADALEALLKASELWELPVFAEIPVDGDVTSALKRLGPTQVAPKFRTGGLEAALFPEPEVLAAAVVCCADHGLSFKLTAGLHRAVRHVDPRTGFVHHGFLNVLAAAAEADGGASVGSVTDTLRLNESAPLADRIRGMLTRPRPLWAGFGSCSISEPLDDLIGLSLAYKES
ncbi:MAG: hypothetical protein ACRDXX_13005 [Stackebrandtia sp.]